MTKRKGKKQFNEKEYFTRLAKLYSKDMAEKIDGTDLHIDLCQVYDMYIGKYSSFERKLLVEYINDKYRLWAPNVFMIGKRWAGK